MNLPSSNSRKARLCKHCGQPMRPKGVAKKPNEYDHASGCPDAINWSKVFDLRCRSKRGEHLPEDAGAIFEAAIAHDPKRYSAMEKDVFNATVPFGSDTRRK